MNVTFDVDSYRSYFDGGAREYCFYVMIDFPGPMAAMKTGLQDTIQAGLSGGLTSMIQAGVSSALAAGQSMISDAIAGLGSSSGISAKDIPFYVRSTTLPEATFEDNISYWMGRQYRLPGNPTYSEWTCTFNIDTQGVILDKFHKWYNAIRNSKTNVLGEPTTYFANPQIYLVNMQGDTVLSYQLKDAWPKSIGSVNLDYSSNDVAQVEVTFAYQYYVVERETSFMAKLASIATGGVLNVLQGKDISGDVTQLWKDKNMGK